MSEETIVTDSFIPLIIKDIKNGFTYSKGKFLGRGGFACSYQITELSSNRDYAVKILDRKFLKEKNYMNKVIREINIQQNLDHPNIVRLYSHFKDSSNFYLVLELCSNNTLLELQERRKTITIPEAKYFCKNIAEGIYYLHSRCIVHRDLKLGNLFLNADMKVKIGDFGLAAHLNDFKELRNSMCGTINYIAPEILGKKGHSFEVDIWAFGCILYVLLVGKLPFEAFTKSDIFKKINSNNYILPEELNHQAKSFIKSLLLPNPAERPSIEEILKCSFLVDGYIPTHLPISCLAMRPRFPKKVSDQFLNKENYQEYNYVPQLENENINNRKKMYLTLEGVNLILKQIHRLISTNRKLISSYIMDNALHPQSAPVYYCTKWIDFSYKYGFGYELCDGSMGLMFNDQTHLICDNNMIKFQHIDKYGSEKHYMKSEFPKNLEKKIKIFEKYKTFMKNKLRVTIKDTPRDDSGISRLPIIVKWERDDIAIALYLSNGTLQVNFFKDHFKVIVCPYMKAISLIDKTTELKTYKLNLLEIHGWDEIMDEKLKYLVKLLGKQTTFKRKFIDDDNEMFPIDNFHPTVLEKKIKIQNNHF
uniref:polo kinase n=1 Tax=Strongyloides stercoralis TaxID=6248 RepID=A0A0K0DYW6_STRER